MSFVIIFPGQGSQYVGMGKDIQSFPQAKETFAEANDVLHYDLSNLCWEGPLETLSRTDMSQVAILTHSLALLRAYAEKHPEISKGYATCGLSLGEYTALVCAKAMTFAQALTLVKLRGELMQKACDIKAGGMLSVIGLSEQELGKLIAPLAASHALTIANLLAPTQFAVSGDKEVLGTLEQSCKAAKARVIPLKVAGAFHSILMKPAEQQLAQQIEKLTIQIPQIPVVSNVYANYMRGDTEIRDSLTKQLTAPVKWWASIQLLMKDGVDTFYEIGPGNQLVGLLKRNAQGIKTISISKVEDIH